MRRIRSARTVLLLLASLALLAALPVRADVLTVCASGCDWPSIQAAVNAAAPGDTIRITSAQPHTEANVLVFTSVVIEGIPGLNTVVQAAAAPDSLVGPVLVVPADVTLVVRDLTLRYGSVAGSGGAVRNLGHLTLDRVSVRQSSATTVPNGDGGGIYNSGTLVLRDSMVTNCTADSAGGAISNATGATLLATDSLLYNNDALDGGGLFNDGDATLRRVQINGGDASYGGGGIYNRGDLKFSGAVIANSASAGGGIYQDGGSLEVSGSIFSDNTADGDGGGGAHVASGSAWFSNTTFSSNIASDGGALLQDSPVMLRLVNVTLSNNQAVGDGGGLFVTGTRRARIDSSTIVENHADRQGLGGGDGGGIFLEPCAGTCPTDRVFLANSILAGNVDASPSGPLANDCSGLITSEGYDLLQDVSSGAVGPCRVDGDLTGVLLQVDPLLGGLADNGGTPPIPGISPPYTHAELGGSPAIDHGDPAGCVASDGSALARDQRGALRVGRCDLGAFESGGVPLLFADSFESGDPLFWRVP
jgi:hypothetical protein